MAPYQWIDPELSHGKYLSSNQSAKLPDPAAWPIGHWLKFAQTKLKTVARFDFRGTGTLASW